MSDFSPSVWALTLSAAEYIKVETENWVISYWVGSYEAGWNNWENRVEDQHILGNATDQKYTALFSPYILSIKMDGLIAPGDGVIMGSTNIIDNRGAVAIVQNGTSNGIDTFRFNSTSWAKWKLETNANIVAKLLSSTESKSPNLGFEAFWTPDTSSPYTCTAW